jgi:hypothetical protein
MNLVYQMTPIAFRDKYWEDQAKVLNFVNEQSGKSLLKYGNNKRRVVTETEQTQGNE